MPRRQEANVMEYCIDAKNTADNSIYGAEKVLSEYASKISDETKAEINAAVDEAIIRCWQ